MNPQWDVMSRTLIAIIAFEMQHVLAKDENCDRHASMDKRLAMSRQIKDEMIHLPSRNRDAIGDSVPQPCCQCFSKPLV